MWTPYLFKKTSDWSWMFFWYKEIIWLPQREFQERLLPPEVHSLPARDRKKNFHSLIVKSCTWRFHGPRRGTLKVVYLCGVFWVLHSFVKVSAQNFILRYAVDVLCSFPHSSLHGRSIVIHLCGSGNVYISIIRMIYLRSLDEEVEGANETNDFIRFIWSSEHDLWYRK